MDGLRTEVIKRMRSCMISNKERLSVRQLSRDYMTIIGEEIPYKQLGHRKLEDFLLSAPNEFILTRNGYEYWVKARESEKSAHITEMISKQKTKKMPPRVRFFRNQPPPRLQHVSRWRPKSNTPNKYNSSKRPQAVSHAQFVDRGSPATGKTPSVASKVVIPEHSTYNVKPQPTSQQPPAKKVDMNHRLTTNRLKENIKSLVNNGSLNGNASVTKSNGTSHMSHTQPNNLAQKSVQNQQDVIDDLNPLASTKKRLIKKMSELSLERDSGNSSPTGDIPVDNIPVGDIPTGDISPPPCKSSDFVRTGDPLADLKHFAELHKLGEVTVHTTNIMGGNKFYCKIKVGSKYMYSGYPKSFLKLLEAQNYCSELGLKDLIPKYRRKSLLIASQSDILERIPPMLEKHSYGIWAWQLKLDYADKYNEFLSEDWLQIIDSSPCVQIEKISDDYILHHCRPGDKGQLRNMAVPVSNVSVPSNTIQPGDDGKLNAEVTCVMSAAEIWCQQTGTEESEKYIDMMERLEVYYQEHSFQLIPQTISTAGYYIVKYDGKYYRVRAVKVSEAEVECFFIDWGDEMSVPRSDIFELKREYASTQAQAFVCRLFGLEELYEVSHDSQSLANLYDKIVVIEIAVDDTIDGSLNDAVPVFMYHCETGESINEELITKLTVELATPTLSQDGITEVYVSNIESNGDLYIQVRSQGYEKWRELKQQLEEELNERLPMDTLYNVTKSNSKEKLYFIKNNVDGSWNRIKLIDWSPPGDFAQIYFVDDGHTVVIKVASEELYPLEAISDVFNNYPYQAVRVQMVLKQIPSNFVDLASKLLPKDHPMLLRIEKTTEDNLPLVKLFKRNPDDCLFCINTSVDLDVELKKEENNTKSRFKFVQDCVPSTGALQCPTLPEIEGDYCEVYIPVAVSPYNFFIQLMESKEKLNELMEKLQKRYQHVQYGNLKVEDVLPGSIYASKHGDGFWYRTSVIKVIHSGSVSVFYCDFGYYQTVPVKQLIPLDKEFMELPYQAIKAKLAGIKPTQSKWTVHNCEQFKDMVEKKPFLFALLKNIEKDILYESDLVLKVVLADTSSNDDLFIGQELINLGIAVSE